MASMKRVNEESCDQENITSKFAKLSTHVGAVHTHQRRVAFREVGNNLPNPQKGMKENTTLPQPQEGFKKCENLTLPFKEIKKIPGRIRGHGSASKLVAVDEAEEVGRDQTDSLSSRQLAFIDVHKPAGETEYSMENLNYLRSLERKYAIQEGFLEGQETTPKMRTVLVKWLIEVHARLELEIESLHLSVATVDRYLQENRMVGPNFLQLVGTTALLVACKYEETICPTIEDLIFMCEGAFYKKHFITMEVQIMKKLDHSFARPSSVQFLRRYNDIVQVSRDHDLLGMFILELALVEYEMSHIKPSLQAAAACCLSLGILDEVMDLSKLWTPILVHYTTYEYGDLKELVVSLAKLVNSRSSKFEFIRSKYASSTYDYISSSSKLKGPLLKKLTTDTDNDY